MTPWTVACQASLSMGFLKQEYWSGLPFPSPGDLPNPGIKSRSPTLQTDSLPSEPPRKPKSTRVGSLSLLQGIYPTQGSNPHLLHCRQILYHWATREGPKQQLLQIPILGTSLVVQWLKLCALNTGDQGSIPSPGTRFNLLQLRVCLSQIKDPT